MEFHDRLGNDNLSWPEIQQKKALWSGMPQSVFISKVLPYFGCGLLLTALGTAVAKNAGSGLLLFSVFLNFILYFILMWNRHTPGLNVVLFYAYAFVNGIMLGPLVALAQAVDPLLLTEALGLTSVGFFGMAIYVITTGKDCSGLGIYLFTGLLVVIIAGIVNLFVGGAGLGLGISVLTVLLFMGFTAYDMSNIMLKFRSDEYILATVELYLDFLNLFVAILRILIHVALSANRRN